MSLRKIKFHLPRTLQKLVSESKPKPICVGIQPQERQTIMLKQNKTQTNLCALYKHLEKTAPAPATSQLCTSATTQGLQTVSHIWSGKIPEHKMFPTS